VAAEPPSTVVVGGREKVVVVSTVAVETGSSVMMVGRGVPDVTGMVMKGVTVAVGAEEMVRRTVVAEEVELMKMGSAVEEGRPVEVRLELEVRVELEMGAAVEDGPTVVVT
jgi:hypothetical protein